LCFYALYLIVFKKEHKLLYVIALIGLTFLIKLPNLYFDGYGSDEPSWITTVHEMANNFNPYITFDPTTSGIGAMIPLYLFNTIFHINYFTLRLFETIIDLTTLFFTFKVLESRLNQNKPLLYLAMVLFYGFLYLSFDREFNTYNTEHFCILIFSIVLYSLNRIFIFSENGQKQSDRKKLYTYIVWAGLFLGFSVFVKLQNVPVMFFMFILFMLTLLSKKLWRETFVFVACCTLPVILFLLFFLYKGTLNDFYERYLVTNIEYNRSSYVNAMNPNLQHKIGLDLRSISSQSYHVFMGVFSIIALSLSLIFGTNFLKLIEAAKKNGLLFYKKNYDFLFALGVSVSLVVLFCLTIYEIVIPQNYFHHYFILLYQPLLLLFACMKWFKVKKWALIFLMVINFFFLCGKNYIYAGYYRSYSKYVFRFKNINGADAKFHNEISQLDSATHQTNCSEKYIILWGTMDIRVFVYGKFLPAYRDVADYHLLAHTGKLKDYYINCFISDIKTNIGHNKVILLQYNKKAIASNYKSFADFVNENNLNRYFKSIKVVSSYPEYSFYEVTLTSK